MAKIDKPEKVNNHSERLEEMDAIVEYLLEACDKNADLHQQAMYIKIKLTELKFLFKGEKNITVSSYGLVSRQQAKRNGHLDISLPDSADDLEYPVITGRSFEEVAEQKKAIYKLEQEIDALLKRVDEINEKSGILVDVYHLAKGLHSPAKFRSDEIQNVILKYPVKVRETLKNLGMKAFLEHSKVRHNDIEEVLSKSA